MRLRPPQPSVIAAGVRLAGAACLAWAVLVRRAWFSRHLFQFYFAHQEKDAVREWALRGVAAALGLALVLGAPRVARMLGGGPAAVLRRAWPTAIGVVLALVVSELVLRRTVFPCHEDPREVRDAPIEVRIGTLHPRYGWVYLPSRSTPLFLGGRPSTFAVNALGFRASDPAALPEPRAPTIVFAGESIAAGHGLDYGESFPAVVGETLHVQAVNVATHGYGSDQAYLRLADALGSLDRVLATVTVFVPAQLERNVLTSRPHLLLDCDGALTLTPPSAQADPPRTCLLRLACALLPYHDDPRIELTAAILRASDAAARERGAKSLFVVPSIGPDRPVDAHLEGWLLHELFDAAGLPYVVVDINRSLLLPAGEVHPNARGARKIADAVSARLRSMLPAL